jgi:succinoglycan biosynthesis transport protein ExoP
LPLKVTTPLDQPAENPALHLRDYLAVVRRRWFIVALTMALAAGLAVALSLAQTPGYQASAEVLIQARSSAQVITISNNFAVIDQARNVETEVRVLESQAVKDAAKAKLGHAPDVSVDSEATSDVVTVTARNTDPRRAAADATTYALAYIRFRQQSTVDELLQAGKEVQAQLADVDQRLAALPENSSDRVSIQDQRSFLAEQLDRLQVSANLQQAGGARVLAQAQIPSSPSTPKTVRNALVALALGLLLGLGLAFLVEYLDDRVRSREVLERAAPTVPVIGEIPAVTGWRGRGVYLASVADPNSPAAEAYRTLRTSIQFLGVSRELHTLQITSAEPEEGKTTTIANLAVSLARVGKNVLVVCCDLRRPRVHEYFGLKNDVGFTSVLLGETTVSQALQPVRGQPNLAILAAGPPPPNPSELLSSPKALETLRTLENARDVDLILIDSPPVLPVSDALVVAGLVDTTVLVASARKSSRRAVHRAVELLQRVNAPLVATILNAVSEAGGYGYGYGYNKYKAEASTVKPRQGPATSPPASNGDEATETIEIPGFPHRSHSEGRR